MAKDPAILFYTSDFLTGTLLMSFEEKGIYIHLLCIQHQIGAIPEKDMLNICSSYDSVMKKFDRDENGLYRNKRMHEEIEKRVKYSLSRKKNRSSKKDMSNISKTYDKHMENENENRDIKDIGGMGEKGKPKEYYYDLFDKIKADELFLESCQKTYRMSAIQLHYQLQQFFREKLGLNLTWESPHDCQKNFFYWLGKRGDDIRMPVPDTPANVDKKAIDDFYNSRMNPADRAGRQTEEFIIEGEEDE